MLLSYLQRERRTGRSARAGGEPRDPPNKHLSPRFWRYPSSKTTGAEPERGRRRALSNEHARVRSIAGSGPLAPPPAGDLTGPLALGAPPPRSGDGHGQAPPARGTLLARER